MKSKLAIREQTGQMLIAGFEGTRLTPETEDLIRNHHIGGLILFGRNYENPEQLRCLIADLQKTALSSSTGLPLFISVDQEGGRVARLPAPFTDYPPASCLGHARSESLAFRFGQALATELLEVGINMDYAPVLDVNTNPDNPIIGDRAFSTDPEWASRLGAAFIRGFQETGMLAVGKHFPGHGDTRLDSHLDLPTVDRTLDILEKVELMPFRDNIHMPAVMTAHVMYPAWDPQFPATFSKIILQKVLRQRLGFKGVIISDDLEMKAVEKHWPVETIPALGVNAGVDIFLICHSQEKIRNLHNRLTEEVEQGAIPHQSIEHSVTRIMKLKDTIKPIPEKNSNLSSWGDAHQKLADEMRSHLPIV